MDRGKGSPQRRRHHVKLRRRLSRLSRRDGPTVNQDIAEGLELKTASGVLVDQAEPGTPSAEAGLKSGDVISKLNGRTIKDAADLTRHVGALKPGDKIGLSFLRDGAEKSVNLTLGSLKAEETAMTNDAQNGDAISFGVQLAPAKQVSGAGDDGVAIVNVDPNGAAASKGPSGDDVILEVSGKPASQPDEVKADIAAAKQDCKKAAPMRVKTAGAYFVAFAFPTA